MLKTIGFNPGLRFGSTLADRTMHLKSILASVLLVGLLSNTLMAAVPSMTPKQLREYATHMVKGKVIKIDFESVRKGNVHVTSYRAKVKITKVEKGQDLRVGSYVYILYCDEEWLGEIGANDLPETVSHSNRPHEGQTLRIYMKRDRQAADGSRLKEKNKDANFDVLLPNGFEELQFKTKTVWHPE
jgi:hypothetical protein